MPTAINAAAAIAEWRAGLGVGGRPESASMTGSRETVRPGHQAAAVAPSDREEDSHRDQPPGKAETVDAMVDRGLERWCEDDPEHEASDRPGDCGDRPDDGTVRHEHEAEVLLRRADGREHAELPEPSLRDDGEPCRRNQRRQQEEDGGHGEDRQRLRRVADVASTLHGAREGRVGAVGLGAIERLARRSARLDEHGDPVRARGRGRDESELVAQLARVLDDADDRPSSPVERQGRSDPQSQRLCNPVGDGDLTGAGRVAASAECEQVVAVGAVGDL